ncbi:MAG: hypothetical protein Unbinned8472contig1000_4 [Prokaryotic dsDNA virus sp.]|nr:MAG: hypothetical protein Unbinned8472contig1000_4 [Prokaryotic dsDNA virus sp.]|tara:strand:+ start:18593 stop:18931 length:339 start_codon:yes stop_codon:yes gene_type:complete
MTTRDELRSVATASKERRREKFSFGGKDFEVLAPTVGEYMKIKRKSKDTDDLSVWAMIFLLVVPGTTERVFDDTDYNMFMNQGFDGILSSAQDALISVLLGAQDEGKDTPVS